MAQQPLLPKPTKSPIPIITPAPVPMDTMCTSGYSNFTFKGTMLSQSPTAPPIILNQCEGLISPNNHGMFVVQSDGRAVIYDRTDVNNIKPIWQSIIGEQQNGYVNGFRYNPPYKLVYQKDGNLILQDAGGNPVWAIGSSYKTGENQLLLQDNFDLINFNTFNMTNKLVWNSNNSIEGLIKKF
jgi:hypothetical protein